MPRRPDSHRVARATLAAAILAACGTFVPTPGTDEPGESAAAPAPPDSLHAADSLAPPPWAEELERRLLARMASLARAQAAALLAGAVPETAGAAPADGAGPPIERGPVALVRFPASGHELGPEARARIAAAARLIAGLPGLFEVVGFAAGGPGAPAELALARARGVYRALVAEVPALAARAVVIRGVAYPSAAPAAHWAEVHWLGSGPEPPP